MNNGFRARKRVKVGICREFLADRHVVGLPTEEKVIAHVDELNEDGRVENALPSGCRAQNGPSAKEKEQNLRRSLNKSIDDTIL